MQTFKKVPEWEATTENGNSIYLNFNVENVKKSRVEFEIITSLSGKSGIEFDRIDADSAEIFARHKFLQGSEDLHGSHLFFYWSRCRGQGFIVRSEKAAVLVNFSIEMNCITLVRPVGSLDDIASLVNEVAAAIRATLLNERIVIRHCGEGLVNRLIKKDWKKIDAPLLASSYLDDETWPEIIINQAPEEFPLGHDSYKIRKALYRHAGKYVYRAEDRLLDIGELDFIAQGSARTEKFDGYEDSFNQSVISYLKSIDNSGLTFHYLQFEEELIGFCITGRNGAVSHNYYSGVRKEARLATFFDWQVYLHERKEGAVALNIGGSERESLYRYSAKTFPGHTLKTTQPLEYFAP